MEYCALDGQTNRSGIYSVESHPECDRKLARGYIVHTEKAVPFEALIIVGIARSIKTLIMPKQLYSSEDTTTLSSACCFCCTPSVRPAGTECLQKPKLMSIFTQRPTYIYKYSVYCLFTYETYIARHICIYIYILLIP